MSFKGENSQGARDLFFNRFLYDAFAFSKDGSPKTDTPMAKNFHEFEKLLFGRVSPDFMVIEPIVSRMENLTKSITQPLMALNFVADAFKDLQRDMIHAFKRQEINPETSIGDPRRGLIPFKAYSRDRYLMHVDSVNSAFFDNFTVTARDRGVSTFEEFFPLYMEYLVRILPRVPITKSGFIPSSHMSPLDTGLCIEIAQAEYDKDKDKYEKFISDPNFDYFRSIAAKRGFVVDKHIPWRLVADLAPTTTMFEYAKIRNSRFISTEDLVSYYYNFVFDEEYETFKEIIAKAYNAYARSNPVLYKKTLVNGCLKMRIVRPSIESVDNILQRLGDQFWLAHFIRARNLETGLNYDRPALAQIIDNAESLRKKVDVRKALGYIDRKYNGFMYREGSFFYNTMKRDLQGREQTSKSLMNDVKYAIKDRKKFVY